MAGLATLVSVCPPRVSASGAALRDLTKHLLIGPGTDRNTDREVSLPHGIYRRARRLAFTQMWRYRW